MVGLARFYLGRAAPQQPTNVAEDDRMARYEVMVDDNFHHQEEDDRWRQGVYETVQDAVAVCRSIVDASLEDAYRPGISAKELYDHYMNFGDNPFIVVLDGTDDRSEFSAWSYAKERCRVICQERSPVPQAAVTEPAGELAKILGLPRDGRTLPATRTVPGSMIPVQALDHNTSISSQISDCGEFLTIKSTITAFVAKFKGGLGRVGNVIWWIAVAWIGLSVFVQTIRVLTGTADWEPRAGDPCGPGYRYVWIGVGPSGDLSCEPE